VSRVITTGGELPEDAVGGELSGAVSVGGDDDAGAFGADERSESVGLRVGERDAHGSGADVVAVVAEGESQRVEGAFDEDRRGSGGQRCSSVRP
jgi:hypothetical protein